MEMLARVALVIVLALAGLAVLAALGFASAIHPPRYVSHRTPADFGWGFEPVALRTRDGLLLSGWFIPREGQPTSRAAAVTDEQPSGGPAIVVLHGYPFDKGNILGVTPFLHRDYDLLLIDFRHVGESQGSFTTIGHREWLDLLAAVDYLRARGASSVGVWGFSLGAAVALMALPHTDAIAAVAADSPYADLGAMAVDYYRPLPVVDRLLAAMTELLSQAVLGVRPSEVSPERAVAGAPVPVLLIHSTADSTIPVSHYERLKQALAANPQADFWLQDGALHGMTYAGAQQDYERRVLAFFARHLR